ncbi:MAG: hypothetical protein ACTSVI_16005 [Promethearchaeota archaeon]
MDFTINNMSEINKLNQRGGRMLSIVDLIALETLTIDLAAYSLVAIRNGASFLCCALRGGVGKTTLMGALLGLIPSSEKIVTIESEDTIREIRKDDAKKEPRCLVVHEIGSGSWYGYLWGKPVLEYFRLKNNSLRLASNIHADNLPQVMKQVRAFGGSIKDLSNFNLIYFISLAPGRINEHQRRVVNLVLEFQQDDGKGEFHEIHDITTPGKDLLENAFYNRRKKEITKAKNMLERMLDDNIYYIEDVHTNLSIFHEK